MISFVQFIGSVRVIISDDMLDLLRVQCGSIIKGDHMQIPSKLAANLWKASESEISYNCVVIEGYRTGTSKSYGKRSFH